MFAVASKNIIQPKLSIGQPNDQFEQEANQVADQVMQMDSSQIPTIQRKREASEGGELQMMPIQNTITPMVQMQAEEEEELQMKIQEHSVVPTIQKLDDGDTNPQGELCGRPLPQTEVEQRNQFYADFTRELTGISEEVRNRITISLCDFSIRQLTTFRTAGLRLWEDGSLPPIFSEDVERDSRRGSASYARSIRTIFIGSIVTTGYLTHELAHAWDHIRNLPPISRVRLDDLNERQRRRLMRNPGQFLSETNRRQELRGSDETARMTFSQMHANYLRRLPYPRNGFGLGAEPTYAGRNPQEFYAEGYAVFHSNSILEQAKIFLYARELYVYLYNEAIAESMPVPNFSQIRRASRQIHAARGIR